MQLKLNYYLNLLTILNIYQLKFTCLNTYILGQIEFRNNNKKMHVLVNFKSLINCERRLYYTIY